MNRPFSFRILSHRRTLSHRPSLTVFAPTLLLVLACGAPEADAPAEVKPRPVRTVQAQSSAASLSQVYSGTVRAASRSRLAFQVPGRLLDRPVELGSRLQKGDLVARLDPVDFRLRVERAESSLRLAEARLREAEAAYGRTERLYAEDHAPRAQLDGALAALEVARSAVDGERRGLDMARRDLGHTKLVAPGPITVVDVFAEAGEILAAGTPVVSVAEAGALELEWNVPEQAVGDFQVGLEVEARLPALGVDLNATITEVGNAPRDGGAAFPVRARLESTDAQPLAGMAAEVRSQVSSADASVLLPADAVAGDPGGHYVLVVVDGEGETRMVERRAVVLGELRPHGLEIVSGLQRGETVVAAGVTFLADGQTVRLLRADPLAELPAMVAPASDAETDGETGR